MNYGQLLPYLPQASRKGRLIKDVSANIADTDSGEIWNYRKSRMNTTEFSGENDASFDCIWRAILPSNIETINAV